MLGKTGDLNFEDLEGAAGSAEDFIGDWFPHGRFS